MENLKDLTLRKDIKCWARDHPDATFQDVCLEVHRYQEEDPSPRCSVVIREAAVEEEEVLCSEVGGQQRQQKMLAEEIQRQQ